MNLGLDIGYNAVKGVSGERRFTFPTITGTPDLSRFSLNGSTDIVLESANRAWLVGQGAAGSRFQSRREDREWIDSQEYDLFIQAALSELSASTAPVDVTVVAGLPVSYYEADAARLKDRLLGQHRIARQGRSAQNFNVVSCYVLMQGIGVVLSLALTNAGKLADRELAAGRVGVIDIGGKTTNLVSTDRLKEVRTETHSALVGAWDAVRQMGGYLDTFYPGLDLRDHEIARVIKDRQVWYDGQKVDLNEPVRDILEPMASAILSEATRLWNGGHKLVTILIAGGGALLIGPYIRQDSRFGRARVVEDPVYANAIGYFRYAQFKSQTDILKAIQAENA